MKKYKTFSAVLLILVLAGITGNFFYFSGVIGRRDEVSIANFPKTIGEWSSIDVPLNKRVYDLLETKNLIMRDYKNPKGEMVNLYIIYSQDDRKVSHPPEICLQGDGATVVEKSPLNLSSKIKATKLVLEKKNSREIAVYWYKAGKEYTNDYINQQIKVSLDRLLGKRTSLALIRVIAVVENDNEKQTLAKILSFCSAIEPLVLKYAP
ncbi:MAG: exosortase C-terminal domain/associated protein EpsI [Candidatus Omnitrophota bacterium]